VTFGLQAVAPLLLALTLAACNKGDAAATSDSASATSTAAQEAAEEARRPALALPVMAEEARDGDLVLRVTTTGQIRSDAAVKLRAEVAGKLLALTEGCEIVPAGLGERVGDFGALALVA
jgi:hypothetical protein